jgi:hypothetical protein
VIGQLLAEVVHASHVSDEKAMRCFNKRKHKKRKDDK